MLIQIDIAEQQYHPLWTSEERKGGILLIIVSIARQKVSKKSDSKEGTVL